MEARPVRVIALLCLLSLAGRVRAKASRDRPRNVTLEAVNSTTIKVTWQPPRSYRLCQVSRYIIRYKHDGLSESLAERVYGNETSMHIHNLVPGTRFYVRLVAVGCRGKSHPTKWVKVKTKESVMGDSAHRKVENKLPGKPSSVRTRTLTDSIILMWEPPDDNVLVRGYMVGYGEGVPDVNWQYVDEATRTFTIKNLKHSTQYVISIRAFNNFGKGPVVYDLIYTREEDAPTAGPLSAPIALKSRILSPSTVWLQWTDPSLGRTQKITDDRYYMVTYSPVPQGKAKTIAVKALNCVIYDMKPSVQYEFRVKTRKGNMETPYGIGVYNKTFEAPPGSPPRHLKVSPTNSSTEVRVTWQPTKKPNGILTGYLVLYSTDPSLPNDKWDVEGVLGQSLHAPVRDLKTDTVYYFKAQARNDKGYGPFSEVVQFHVGKPLPKKEKEFPESTAESKAETEEEQTEEEVASAKVETSTLINEATTTLTSTLTAESVDRSIAIQTEAEPLVGNISLGNSPQSASDVSQPMSKEVATKASLTFHTLVTHKVSAIITWSGEDWYHASEHGHYKLIYYRSDEPETKWSKKSKIPLFIVDDLEPEEIYTYEVVKTIKSRNETVWTRSGIIDTSTKES